MGGFFGGLFGKGGEPASGGGSGPTSAGWAKIVLHDSGGDGQPELFVDPIQNTAVSPATSSTTTAPQTNLQRADAGYKLNIKLRRVDKVTLDGATGQIILTAKKVGGREAVAKELLRFTLLQQNDNDDSNDSNNIAAHHDSAAASAVVPVTSDVRNAIVHHFMVITEWERQRCAERQKSDPDGYYNDDNDDDDDENQPNFLQARAQKAAHFAKREVEMQRIKKERDRRKAELVAESGGLKYTAIAMANMQK